MRMGTVWSTANHICEFSITLKLLFDPVQNPCGIPLFRLKRDSNIGVHSVMSEPITLFSNKYESTRKRH